MGFMDKFKESMGNAKESMKKAMDEAKENMREHKEESNALKQPLEGAYIRYEVTYIAGVESIAKAKAGAIGLNICPDKFGFRPTITTKEWFPEIDIPYDSITDIRIEKRTISTAEMFLGGGNDPNQQQENNIVIEYTDEENVKRTLRTEMLTGTTIFNQAAKCREFMDLLRQKDILEIIESKKKPAQAGGGVDVVAQIEKLAKLKDAGVITEEEFAAKKAALLDKI